MTGMKRLVPTKHKAGHSKASNSMSLAAWKAWHHVPTTLRAGYAVTPEGRGYCANIRVPK